MNVKSDAGRQHMTKSLKMKCQENVCTESDYIGEQFGIEQSEQLCEVCVCVCHLMLGW